MGMSEETPADLAQTEAFALFEAGDYPAAIAKLRPLAEADDMRAQCKLGTALTRIAEAEQRHHRVEAVKWLDQCVRRYDYPDEEEKDAAQRLSTELIRTAGWDIVGEGRYLSFQFQQAKLNAEQGKPNGAPESVMVDLANLSKEAAFELGVDLYEGNGLPVDYEKGVRAFHRAAELGIPEAAFNLGIAYYVGKGVKADPIQAMRWLKMSAEGSFARAAFMIGIMYSRGDVGPADNHQAILYLRRAEELGDVEAGMLADAIADGAVPY